MSEAGSAEWVNVTLGQLAKGFRGVSYRPENLLDHASESTVTLLRATNIQKGNLTFDDVQFVPSFLVATTQILEVGDIAVCMSNGSKTLVGKSAPYRRNEQIVYTVGAFCSIFKPVEKDGAEFVFHLFRSQIYQNNIDVVLAGSAINNLKNSSIESAVFKVPVDKKLRQKIAIILNSINKSIEKTEALITKYQQIKAGLMHDLFTRGVTADGKLRPPREQAPELYQETPIGWIPKEWDVKRLVDLITFPSGQVDPRQSQFAEWILVAPDHIEKETGRLLGVQTAREQGAISGKYTFQPGDIVYSKIRPYLRKAILADFTGLCSADMYPLRPVSGVNPHYLLGVVLGEHFSRFAESVSMRSGFPKINRDEMSGYRCAVPPGLEQETIAEIFLIQDALLTTTQEELAKLHQQKHGLMHDLLTGKVSVLQ